MTPPTLNLPPLPAEDRDDDELWYVRHDFVAPPPYDAARRQLTPTRPVLVLTGPRGSGKRTMALRLLWERSKEYWQEGAGQLAIRELVPDWEVPDPRRLPAERKHGYLLDLSRDDDQHPLKPLTDALPGLADQLRKASSYLVITATDDHWQRGGGEFEQARVRLAIPPPARQVVTQRVPAERQEWLRDPQVGALLDSELPPADAVRLAEAITRATGERVQAIDHALNEYGRWRPHVEQWFRSHPALRDRALMIAAAVLEGRPVDEVFGAAAALAQALDGGARVVGPLVGPGRSRLLANLGAELDGTVSLARQRPGLDGAVIDHVLLDRPELVGDLWGWVNHAALAGTYVPHRVARMAQVLALRSVRLGRPVFLHKLYRLVAAGPGQRRLAQALLEETVLDPVVGAAVRRWMARWAGCRKASEALVAVIAQVCGGVFAEQFPTVAQATLRRILLRRDSAANERAALAALVRLAGRGGHRRLALRTAVAWMGQESYRYAGGLAFCELMRPDAGPVAGDVADAQAFCLLRDGWQRLRHTGVPDALGTGLIEAWLTAAEQGELPRDVAADLLLLAVEEDLWRLHGDAGPAPVTNANGGGPDLLRRVLRLRRLDDAGPPPAPHPTAPSEPAASPA